MHITNVKFSMRSADRAQAVGAEAEVQLGESAENVLAVTEDWVRRQLNLPETAKGLRMEVDAMEKKVARLFTDLEHHDKLLTEKQEALLRLGTEYAKMQAKISAIQKNWRRWLLVSEALEAIAACKAPSAEQASALVEQYLIDAKAPEQPIATERLWNDSQTKVNGSAVEFDRMYQGRW